ncbi:MAG TPA: hypothetical protein VL634_20785 [Mycobacterium sp.]|nr:hypothetical protein [Mycobacterium sp.]
MTANRQPILTLVTSNPDSLAPVAVLDAPAPKPVPAIDPIRDAAAAAARGFEIGATKNDDIDQLAEHLAKASSAEQRMALIGEFWDTVFLTGYRAACADRTEAGIAEAMADVIQLYPWTGGEPA